MKALDQEEEAPLTLEEIVTKYGSTMTAPEMARKFGGYRHKYRKQALKLGIKLPTCRTKAKAPRKKTPRGSKPGVTRPKMDNKTNPSRLKVRTVDRSNMLLVPVGLNREYVDVPFDATPEEKKAIIEAKIERIKARINPIAA